MSARTPFMPLAGQQNPSSSSSFTASSNGSNGSSSFVANKGNPLHQSSGQPSANPDLDTPLGLDMNKVIPLLGQRSNRTTSQGGSSAPTAPRNLLQLAGANIHRSQTTAPSNDSFSRQSNMPQGRNGANGYSDRIFSPNPIPASKEKPSILTSPPQVYKTHPISHHNPQARDMPLEESRGSLGYSNAHISSEMHHRRQGRIPPMRQLPSPDTSGTTDEQPDISGSFRTSTPNDPGDGHDSGMTGPRRIFPQEYGPDDSFGQYYTQGEMPPNRKHAQESFGTDHDQNRYAKRQRNTNARRHPPAPAITPVEESPEICGRAVSAAPSASCEIFGGFDFDKMLGSQLEHFQNRVNIWQNATEEEWLRGGEEITERLGSIMKKTQVYMERKRGLVANLESNVTEHEKLLRDREKMLQACKEKVVNESQGILGGVGN